MPKVSRSRERYDFSSLEEELRRDYQKTKNEIQIAEHARDEDLLLFLSRISPKKEERKKKIPLSVRTRLARQQQEREAVTQALLAQEKSAAESAPEQTPTLYAAVSPEPKSAPTLTPAPVGSVSLKPETRIPKTEREMLLEDPDMRYVLVKYTTLAHDRDCPAVSEIPDSAFSMTSRFPKHRYLCPKCYHRALIRSCLAEDQTDRLDVYCEAFLRMHADNKTLRRFMLDHSPVLYDAEPDRVLLRHGGERWLLVALPETCQLYRIAYYEDNQTGRMYSRLCPDWIGVLDKLVFRISQYPLARRRNAVLATQKDLAATKNVRPLARISVMYQYYIYADRMRYHKTLGKIWSIPIKILKIREYPDTDYTTVVCRVRKRDAQVFLAALEKMKTVAPDTKNYIHFCRSKLPADDRQSLRSALQNNNNKNK